MKKAYKIVGILLTIVILSSLVGCSFNEARFNMNEDRYREAKLETLVNALQNKDFETMKGLFSKAAIDAVGEKEIEDGINYLFTVFQGNVLSYEMHGSGVSTEIKDGKKHVSTHILAYVYTDAGSYYIRGFDHIINAVDKDNVGLSYIIVLTLDEWPKYGLLEESFVGVFRQDYYAGAVDASLSRDEILNTITTSLENEDMSAIQSLFSTKTIDYVGDKVLEEELERLFSVFKGSLVKYEINSANSLMNVVNGGLVIHIRYSYLVTTETEEYIIFFSGYLVNQASPDETGLEQLKVVRGENWSDYREYDPKFRGVLRVD